MAVANTKSRNYCTLSMEWDTDPPLGRNQSTYNLLITPVDTKQSESSGRITYLPSDIVSAIAVPMRAYQEGQCEETEHTDGNEV